MYTTEKKFNKLLNQQIFGTVLVVIGIVRLIFETYKADRSIRAFSGMATGLFMIALGVVAIVSSAKKARKIKGKKFEISEKGIEFHDADNFRLIPIHQISHVKKSLKKLSIQSSVLKEEWNIELDDYSLSFSESKELEKKVEALRDKALTEKN